MDAEVSLPTDVSIAITYAQRWWNELELMRYVRFVQVFLHQWRVKPVMRVRIQITFPYGLME